MKEPIGHIAATSSRGSALILTVVLTSLLAIVGVLFVMATRVDKMATTATTESRELACAVDTVLSQIEQALVADVPGAPIEPALADKVVAPPGAPKLQEYYDYPDEFNPWLADLEPYAVGSGANATYYWRQISNVGGVLTSGTRDILIDTTIGERDAFSNPTHAADPDVLADADGDGMPDAKWFQVPGVMTSRGKRFYAAVRIVDNGGMLNMNTGFAFDPNDPNRADVDGTSPLQVNAVALATNGAALLNARANYGLDPLAAADLAGYEKKVIWRYLDVNNLPGGFPSPYTPFDISDELELRYRYLLNQNETNTRVETCGLFTGGRSVPVYRNKDTWYPEVAGGTGYDYRHLATTYNMDRIITPRPVGLEDGTKQRKMVNVNTTDEFTLRSAVTAALFEAIPNGDPGYIAQMAAQITANLRDYIDDDDEMTVIPGPSSPFYGFERPCIYISEVACHQVQDTTGVHTSYAIELYKPYFEDRDPKADEWNLVIGAGSRVSIEWTGSRRFHVILAEDPKAPLSVAFNDPCEPTGTMPLYGYNPGDYTGAPQRIDPSLFKFGTTFPISVERSVSGGARAPSVDYLQVPQGLILPDNAVQGDVGAKSIQRDVSPHKCIRRLWSYAATTDFNTPGLGNAVGNYRDARWPGIIQAHPANRTLTNIGELGMVFAENAYSRPMGVVAPEVLIDLTKPMYSRLFNYLTVIDPARHTGPAAETRIMGRININTAPAFVLAQLPWFSYRGEYGGAGAQPSDPNRGTSALEKGQAIVARRSQGPYQSTGDLMQVLALHGLALDKTGNSHADLPRRGPDLTPDTALNDLEERDLFFTRISDLVTVRSDVFTAYVLVRIGEAGPQKRIIAIFDRSRVSADGGKVRLLAYHAVPDPR